MNRGKQGTTALPLCFTILLTLAAAIFLSFISGFPPSTTLHQQQQQLQNNNAVKPPIKPFTSSSEKANESTENNDNQPTKQDTNQQTIASPSLPALKPCPNLILISAARHGSTWFVDSATSCKYSSGLSGTYADDVFKKTEIWTDRPGPVENLTPQQALRYIQRNSSVKFMQTTLRAYPHRAEELLRLAKKENIPVILLRRRAAEAYQSRKIAKARGDWRVTSYSVGEKKEVVRKEVLEEEAQEQLDKFVQGLEQHFATAERLLDSVGNTLVDRFDYDDVKDLRFIRAENCRCFVNNCNFAEDS